MRASLTQSRRIRTSLINDSVSRPRGIRIGWLEISIGIVAIAYLFPLYIVLTNSLKPMNELLSDMISFPQQIMWNNYVQAWNFLDFPKVLSNSLLITIFSNAGAVVFSAMAAHQMVRRKYKFNNIMFAIFVASMIIPLQAVMIPLVMIVRQIGLMDSIFGIVVCYWGFSVSFSIFLFHGFVKSLPYEIEEAALIDGCNPYTLFVRIVFPLLRPVVATVVMLNTLWFWNDFLLPLLLLQNPDLKTIPVAINTLFGQYMKKWDLALPAMVMAMAPAALFFLFLQRQLIEGITSGSIKG
ncbi:carbohydrate ABC transporter permease [Paenibacillus sp. 19GGS1-52]|uniref:carbohydrate ABC transporter permease n=1 Tax=Paenibacillus sp. 19GGS1-52 TaxID=2758563 RepID=UPI001EFB1DCA|nr:carbohydrate ABC transporter permease [Paenibacillus sp. 19GGS1-52]ULO09221.1 carbohydrate ABC transporter permease [Paenibacillus sp. 19GGS1-52]